MAAPTSNNEVTARRLTRLLTGSDGNGGLWGKVKDKISSSINALDVSSVGGAGKYISAISETDGKISATATTMDTTPTASSTNAVTSGGVKTALDTKANDSAVVHIAGQEYITGEKCYQGGTAIVNSTQTGYVVFTLPSNTLGTKYENWDAELKDGAHFREWRLAFPTGASYWGKIRITINGCYYSRNSAGALSKTINIAFNTSTCFLNVGAYDALGYNIEGEFRISDLVWNADAARWEIIVHSIVPSSNNYNSYTIIECWSGSKANLDYARQINWVSTSPTIVTDTSYANTWRNKTFSWSTKPVLQSPYGNRIYDDSTAITRYLGTGVIAKTNLFQVSGSTDGFKVDYEAASSDAGVLTMYTIDDGNAKISIGNNNGGTYKEAISITNGSATIIGSLTGNASTATKATQDSDGNAINATYFKSSGNTTLVSGSATKIGTQNGADVKLTLPTIPAAVSVKGNAESSYRTGQVNLTPANLGISATTSSVTVGSTTFNKYTHPATSGNKHVPSGGSSGQFLGWDSDGTAKWVANPNTDTKVTSSANHYTPATATGSDVSASASGATAAWSIDVVKGVTLNTDGKGHVTGLSVTSGKIPGNPNTDTKQRIVASTAKTYLTGVTTAPTSSNQDLTGVASTKVYATDGVLTATSFSGNLTGNVTGNCSGSSGSCTGNAATATTATKLGSSTLGSGTKPIYLSSGTATECSTYAGGTAVTLNNVSKAASSASFYAPTAGGTANYVLIGQGATSAPTWAEKAPKATTADKASVLIGTYSGSGGALAPSAISQATVRAVMMNKPLGLAAFNTYCDCILMDTYNSSDVPYVTGFGISKNSGNPKMYIFNGAKGNTTTWANELEVLTTASTIVASKISTTAKIGDTNKGVYVAADGTVTAMSYEVNKTVPSNAVFTDANVTQTNTDTSSNAQYRLLMSATADDTTRTEGARKSTYAWFNPSTQTLGSQKFDIAGQCVLNYDTTTSAVYFTFS